MPGRRSWCDKRMMSLWRCYWEHEWSADAALIRILDKHLARQQEASFQAIAAHFICRDPNPAVRAHRFLLLGAAGEKRKRYDLATAFYQQGLRLDPTDIDVRYFLNTNLGNTLNQIGRFAEAEGFCRAAIACDPLRHSAHEFLGVSLVGQGQYIEAAQSFILAIRARPCESRALRHLQTLAKAHGESVAIGIPGVPAMVEQCREMVYSAQVMGTPEQDTTPG